MRVEPKWDAILVIKLRIDYAKLLWLDLFLIIGLLVGLVEAVVYNSMKTESYVGLVSLKVQYKCGDANITTQTIRPCIIVFNIGITNVTLTSIKIRYWFTSEFQGNDVFICNYAEVGESAVTGLFGSLEGKYYLEIGFTCNATVPLERGGDGTSNKLPAGANTGEVQVAIYNDYPYDQANDYSFDETKTDYADWYKITVYYQGALAWGTEPA